MNDENLIPFGDGSRSESEERALQSKGGQESGKSRRRRKTLQQTARMILNTPVTSEKWLKTLQDGYGIQADEATQSMCLIAAMMGKALDGDTKAAAFIRDAAGENPSYLIERERLKIEREKIENKDTAVYEDLDDINAEIYGVSESGTE